MQKKKYTAKEIKKSKVKTKRRQALERKKQVTVDWLLENKGQEAVEEYILRQAPKSQHIIRNRVFKTIEIATATKFAPSLKVQIPRNSPSPVAPVADSRHRKFYCTVCKMMTWTFHEHDGRNTSSTIRHVKVPEDSTNMSK